MIWTGRLMHWSGVAIVYWLADLHIISWRFLLFVLGFTLLMSGYDVITAAKSRKRKSHVW